ncbi:MAG: LysR family transcriptional regulator [Magnetococcales bacterium]|nr:LysR family transcriptional regulator [Magnetococcales bacterium]
MTTTSDLSQFDLNLLVAFNILMNERGVTRASRVLGITQAAMSNTLRRLRDTFNDPLFIKSGHRMEPTARALEVAAQIDQALFYIYQAFSQGKFEAATARHMFRIAIDDEVAMVLLPPLLQLLKKNAPETILELVDVDFSNPLDGLESGIADLIITRVQNHSFSVSPHYVFPMTFTCLFNRGHPLLQNNKIDMKKYLSMRHVQFTPAGFVTQSVVDDTLADLGHTRNIVAHLTTFGMLPFLLKDCGLVATLPTVTAQTMVKNFDLVTAPVPFDIPAMPVGMLWHRRTDRTPAYIWLRRQVDDLMTSHIGPGTLVNNI